MQHDIFAIGVETAVFPLLSNYHVRLGTFTNWPASRSPTKYQLAEAGFFYLGVDDMMRCFHCGLFLINWEDDDNPWEEHARYYEKCLYLLTNKGENFLQFVRQKFRDIPVRQQSGNERETIPVEDPGSSSQNPQDVTEKISTPSTSGGNASDDTGSTKSIVKDIKCIKCFERERNIVFLPCGHIATCAECAEKLDNICFICRHIIHSKWPARIV